MGSVRPDRRASLSAPSDDFELARACAGGDEGAWEEFGRRYFGFIRAFAARLLPGAAAAADLADQVIAELWQRGKIARFEGRSTLKTWLGAVVAHAAANAAERDRRLVPLEGVGRRDDASSPADDEAPERRRLSDLLSEAAARLPASDRLLLLLHYEQGLTLEQIRPVARRSKAALSRRLNRIVSSLRREIESRSRERYGVSARELTRDLSAAEIDLETLLSPQRRGESPVQEKGEPA